MGSSLLEPPLLSRLRAHDRILIAGAGGGFDIYAGLPLFLALRAAGKQVSLANLTFDSIFDVGLRIQAFRQTLDKTRAWKLIPH